MDPRSTPLKQTDPSWDPDLGKPMHRIIVSLTTISSRLPHVHLVIQSLLSQDFSASAYEVRLYLSEKAYLLDKGCPTPTDELHCLVKNNPGRFSIFFTENTGPYRKILPVLNEVYRYDPERFCRTLIVTTDDDTLYPPTFLSGLYAHYLRYHCVIGYRGRTMRIVDGVPVPYRRWSKDINENPSLMNVPTGKDGILYSPFHFNPRVVHQEDALQVAPKADDFWLKFHTLLFSVPSFIINGKLNQEFSPVINNDQSDSLFHSFNKNGGNDEAMNNFDKYFSQKLHLNFREVLTTNIPLLQGVTSTQIKDLCHVE